MPDLRSLLSTRHGCLLAVVAVALTCNPSAAQQIPTPGLPRPRLLLVTPPGGKAGSTVEVAVSGQDLDEPEGLLFSQSGIKAEPGGPPLPPDPKRPGSGPSHRFKVTIPADTPPGLHDVRFVNKWGVSNPRVFAVGDLTEVLEKEPNNDLPEAQRVELNSTINGAISSPTDVDYYIFAGKKGQRVVVSCLASSIDSKLQPAVHLYYKGAPLGFGRDYHGTDALLDCTLPEDGDYYLRLFAWTYTQGSPDHFYRLSITTAPWIDAVFPPVVEPGKIATLTVYGRNLPGGKPDPAAVVDGRVLETLTVKVEVPKDPVALQRLDFRGHILPRSSALDGFEFRLKNDSGTSNPFLLTYATAPVVLDNENNDTPETAQEVTLPCEIAGRIEKKRDRDWYAFSARKGDVYSIELFGDRLGSPLDLFFVLKSSDGKQTLGEFDDNPEILNQVQFLTRTEDPARYRFVAPFTGSYHLQVSSREAYLQAGPRHLYRLRIAPEQPDFRLVVMPQGANYPDGCTVHQGGHEAYTVYVWRLDGFNGELAISASGLPAGVTCPPQTIGPGVKQALLVVSASPDAAAWTGPIVISGTAAIDGKKVVREARAASVTWPVQQNVSAVSRLDRDLVLAVRPESPFTLTAGVDQVTAAPGDKVTVPVKLVRHWSDFKAPLQVTARNLPATGGGGGGGGGQPGLTLTPGKDEGKLTFDVPSTLPPGTYSVVLRGQTQVQVSKTATSKQKANVTLSLPSAPILLTVLPKK
jgi:hypothetical protein